MSEYNLEAEDEREDDRALPRLWNPNAAAAWSLLLTPAFGALLHAANCRTLGLREKARANMMWAWITFIFLAINLGTLLLPDSKMLDRGMMWASIGLLVGWYLQLGRKQIGFVNEMFGYDYRRRGWLMPLFSGAAAMILYVALAVGVMLAFYVPDAAEVAAEVRPMILDEWRKNPDLVKASITRLTLVHKKGDVYEGFLDATAAGKAWHFSITVNYGFDSIQWQIQPLEGG